MKSLMAVLTVFFLAVTAITASAKSEHRGGVATDPTDAQKMQVHTTKPNKGKKSSCAEGKCADGRHLPSGTLTPTINWGDGSSSGKHK